MTGLDSRPDHSYASASGLPLIASGMVHPGVSAALAEMAHGYQFMEIVKLTDHS